MDQAQCFTTQLIEGDGTFNAHRLDNFIKQVKHEECGISYAFVAIRGPQSSGKSTLLNHLFHTNFKEMNAERRGQTTKGIWIARSTCIQPCTIVMDIEGTDGQERGEDDTAFEKQSALFAIAVSDIVIINMWCKDIGLEHAANRPILKTVFQVMLQLFSPRKRTLMFVIRDKTKTPFDILADGLKKDINKIWDSVSKPAPHQLSEFFNVEVVGLSSYEYQEDQFKAEVASLRQKFFHSTAHGGLAGDRKGVIPASGFSLNAQQIWKDIKENKQLDLPSHAIMVATVQCEKYAEKVYSSFVGNKEWVELQEGVKSHFVPGFGEKLCSLLGNCFSSYDKEVKYYDVNVASAKKKQLKEKLAQHVQPAYIKMSEHIVSKATDSFMKAITHGVDTLDEFEKVAPLFAREAIDLFKQLCEDATCKQANWDFSKTRDAFSKSLDSYINGLLSIIEKHKGGEENKFTFKELAKGIIPVITMASGVAASLATGGVFCV